MLLPRKWKFGFCLFCASMGIQDTPFSRPFRTSLSKINLFNNLSPYNFKNRLQPFYLCQDGLNPDLSRVAKTRSNGFLLSFKCIPSPCWDICRRPYRTLSWSFGISYEIHTGTKFWKWEPGMQFALIVSHADKRYHAVTFDDKIDNIWLVLLLPIRPGARKQTTRLIGCCMLGRTMDLFRVLHSLYL